MPGDRFIELAQSEDRHVLDVLFRHAREAVTVQDQSGHLVYANDRAAELVGMGSGAEMVATPIDEIVLPFDMIDETGSPISPADLPSRRVLAGLVAEEMTVGFRSHAESVRWSRVNSSPIKDDNGNVVWAINFLLDVTEHVRAREGERLLALVGEALAAPLRIDESLSALVGILAAELGSWCGVHLVDHRGDLVLAANSDLESGELANITVDDDAIVLGSNRLQARVMKTGSPEVETDTSGLFTDATKVFDEGATAQGAVTRSVACVPVGSGAVAGTLTVARDVSRGAFDATDLVLLRRVSGIASVALANARLYELEHETAEALRAGLTPSALPEWDGFELAARYVPLERFGHIGGDFFDLMPLSPSSYAVVVGDIEGKGVPAAAAVGLARDTIRATIKLEAASDVVLSQLNEALLEQENSRMCTVAYLRIERSDTGAEALIALAGHPPPALLASDGELSFPGTPCPPAGVLPSIQPFDTELSLSPGETLLLYTDGFALPTETPMETIARFIEGGQSEDLDDLLDRMLHDLSANMEVFRDDVLLLALRVT